MNKKVSIIVPIYNVGERLSVCLDSLINQTYTNFEVIMIDDGSIDKSGEICDLYASRDNRFKVEHCKNSGVSSARNKGLEICTGDYIIFVDGDDAVKNNMLEDMVYYLEQNQCDVIITGITFVKDEEVVKEILPTKSSKLGLDIWEYICKDNTGMFGYVPNKLYKANIIKDNNIRFDKYKKIQEDLDFALSVYSKSESFCMLDKSYYLYEQEDKKRAKYPLSYMEIEIKKRDILKNKGIYDKYKSLHCEKLASMIFTYLYWLPKKKQQFINEANRLFDIKCIYDSFDIKSINKLEYKMVIYFLKHKKLNILWNYFKIRSIKNRG